MAGASDDRLGQCTSVLMTVPLEIARRIETFLLANEIACKIRRNETMTPEQLAEQALRAAGPQAAKVLGSPVIGRLLRTRVKHAVKTEITVSGAAVAPAYDVLVRPQDLPTGPESEAPSESADIAAGEADPRAREADQPVGAPVPAATEGMVPITALSWDAAWSLAGRLQGADIRATVLPVGDAPRGAGSIGQALFQVVVQAGDAERARQIAATEHVPEAPQVGQPSDQ